MFSSLTDVGVMHLSRLISLIMVVLILSSFFIANGATAKDIIDNNVVAEFYIDLVTGTDLNIEVIMNAYKLTTDATYDSEGIKSANEQDLGAFRLLLYQMLDRQLDETFKNADILNFTMPTFDGDKFREELNVKLTSSFFGLNNSVNADDFINGMLDMGAFVNYSLNLQVEPGWNNTYIIELGQTLGFKRTTGTLDGNYIEWVVENWNGNNPSRLAELQLKMDDPTTPTLESEDIFLDFILDSKDVLPTSFITNILVKSADIRSYNVLPSFISNLDFMPADGLRLLVDNGFITWDDFYEKTIKPLEEKTVSTIEKSSFNQTLNIIFSWDNETTTDCLVPYEILNMDNKPSIKAILTDSQVALQICDISSRALFGLINSGAEANISAEDVNFGDELSNIGYNYNVTLYLPDNLYLDGENVYTWNESIPISGEFESDNATSYTDEEKDTLIEIEVKSTDLNLLSFFTGKTELTFGLSLKETRNYNVTILPDEFTLPEKVSIGYLNSDAFRVCIEENVFSEESITDFLEDEKELFEITLRQVLSGLEVSGNVNRDVFEESLKAWDKDISKMDADTPVKTGSSAHSAYPISFEFSFLPPGFNIPTKKFNFTGLPNQDVTYKMIFPHGISIDVSDPLNKAVVKETNDERDYIEITFSASESNLTVEVSCSMTAPALFIVGVFMPCIVSLIITFILIVVIYIIRKRRKGRKIETTTEEEDLVSYEDEDYYVPPPPGTK
jgi:hypothetical protein